MRGSGRISESIGQGSARKEPEARGSLPAEKPALGKEAPAFLYSSTLISSGHAEGA